MELSQFVPYAIAWVLAVIGAASLVVQGLALSTGITPTTRDDEIVSKLQAGIRIAQTVLSKLALNPSPGPKTPV